MAYPFKTILVPVDLEDKFTSALELAAQMARSHEAKVYLLHVVASILGPGDPATWAASQEDVARKALVEVAAAQFNGVRHELLTASGEAARQIVAAARHHQVDVIVMPTHGRKGLSHLVLGSVAERVVREASCPVITVKPDSRHALSVAEVMSRNPPVVAPQDTLLQAEATMRGHGVSSLAVCGDQALVGIITDRDLRAHSGRLEQVQVAQAMTPGPIHVASHMSLAEAGQLLIKLKVGALPVLENGKLVGMVSSADVIAALLGEHSHE